MERTSYCLRDGESPCIAVVNAIAEHEGASPDDIGQQLYDVIDPDALDALFRPRTNGKPRSDGKAVFTYRGYRVTYRSDGWVYVVDDTAAPSGASEKKPADE
ncbi:HalOD1 output domain-containing protein [Haladaptatus salinisoli]|uniref:HalOD1 output domain-containing protein n=1 Tax=Haladaptatus salinisoli TaxID=2884876 RepID=UPI001D0AD1BF|nr:HalOD1 output domain-containing protein [Haladaptatus salinisoli]